VIELFAAQGFGLFDIDFDPCDATTRPASVGPVPASCIGGAAHQVTTAERDSGALKSPADQYNQITGGNPDLQPEVADTFTYGVVFQPSALPGFNLSVDYFDISIEDAIQTIGAGNTLNLCYNSNDAAACSRISRNAGNGSLWVGTGFVQNLNNNIGGFETSGVDINANYGIDLADWGMANSGSLQFAFVGTWLESLVTDSGTGTPDAVYDCTGFYGAVCGPTNPEWRHRFRTTWLTPWDVDVSGTWRHYGEGEIGTLGADGSLNNGGTRIDRYLDSIDYFDLAASWQVMDTVTVRAGVNNVLDTDPPLSYGVGTTGNGNTYPQLYDARGRYFFFGVTANF
jgi:outer membrane receptor protein involved in Fe transport